ncbi:MAG TPA: hypothetical protein VMW52_04650 [Phycisphaerae bacterium]|nr:hypothetical protein [Phycisphaerae bacterium]
MTSVRTESDAVACLATLGVAVSALKLETAADGSSIVVESYSCGRCGGHGHLGRGTCDVPWGVCYRCFNGPKRAGISRTPLIEYARKAKATVARRKSAAAKREAKDNARVERRLEGERKWCEANGHGRVTFAERDAKRAAEWAARDAKKVHVGVVGERSVFTATVKAIPSWDSAYGTVYMVIMEDAAGNSLVWKTGSPCLEVGETATFKATVKEHGDYKGVARTLVTRVKPEPIAEAA